MAIGFYLEIDLLRERRGKREQGRKKIRHKYVY
jgi:hypothetical protein